MHSYQTLPNIAGLAIFNLSHTMKASQFTFATLRQTPSDADVISAQLMLRAGLIRKLASGLYVWLPMGLRVLKRVEKNRP